MSKVYGLWYGGSSYSAPYVQHDTEEFEDMMSAQKEFIYRNNAPHRYPDVNEETCEMQIFLEDPRDSRDPYPDYIMKFVGEDIVLEPA